MLRIIATSNPNKVELGQSQIVINKKTGRAYWDTGETRLTFGGSEATVNEGEGNNSIQGEVSAAFGDGSIALGIATVAGCKGYRIKAYDTVNKYIYLTTSDANCPTIDDGIDHIDTDFVTPEYEQGDMFSIVADKHYSSVAMIESIEFNRVKYTYDLTKTSDPVATAAKKTEETDAEDRYAFYVPLRADKGVISITSSSVAFGSFNGAVGDNSFVSGTQNLAGGENSHAEGDNVRALGKSSHAEGTHTSTVNQYSHAEGNRTTAFGANGSHAEGTSGYPAIANGYITPISSKEEVATAWVNCKQMFSVAFGAASHVEGENCAALGSGSHCQGTQNMTYLNDGHAEGRNTVSYGYYSHAEGQGSLAGQKSLVELIVEKDGVLSITDITSISNRSVAYGKGSHIEGCYTIAYGNYSHAEGSNTIAEGISSHAEGSMTHTVGLHSHAEGYMTFANGDEAHSEGKSTRAEGDRSHAEGLQTWTQGTNSHAEGVYGIAWGYASHIEGGSSRDDIENLINVAQTAEGATSPEVVLIEEFNTNYFSMAHGSYSHIEGCSNLGLGFASHTEGLNNINKGYGCHVEGYHNIGNSQYGHVSGKYNDPGSKDQFAVIVGNGSSDAKRKNIHTLDWNGNAWFKGNVTVGANNDKLVTQSELQAAINNGGGGEASGSGVYYLSGKISTSQWNTLAQQYHTFVVTDYVELTDVDNTLVGPHTVIGDSNRVGDYRNGIMSRHSGIKSENINFYNITPAQYFEGAEFTNCTFTNCAFAYGTANDYVLKLDKCTLSFCSCINEVQITLQGNATLNNCVFTPQFDMPGVSVYIEAEGDMFLNGCRFEKTGTDQHSLNISNISDGSNVWIQNCTYKNITINSTKQPYLINNVVNGELQAVNYTANYTAN